MSADHRVIYCAIDERHVALTLVKFSFASLLEEIGQFSMKNGNFSKQKFLHCDSFDPEIVESTENTIS